MKGRGWVLSSFCCMKRKHKNTLTYKTRVERIKKFQNRIQSIKYWHSQTHKYTMATMAFHLYRQWVMIIHAHSMRTRWFMQLDLASTWWFLEVDVRRELDRAFVRTLTHTDGKLPVATPLNSLWRFGSKIFFLINLLI
jgi:hypothetical protein